MGRADPSPVGMGAGRRVLSDCFYFQTNMFQGNQCRVRKGKEVLEVWGERKRYENRKGDGARTH